MLLRYRARRGAGRRVEFQVFGSEQALEDGAGVDLRRHGGCGAAPGDAVGVGAAIARIAVSDGARVLAAQFQRGEPRFGGESAGRDLIRRNAVMDVGAAGLFAVDARQEGGSGAGMVARAVAEFVSVVVGKPGENQHLLAVGFQRGQNAREFVVAANGLRRPVLHNNPIWHVGEHEADGRLADAAHGGEGGRHRVEHRQGDGGSHAAQESAAGQAVARDKRHLSFIPFRIWNGLLETISMTKAENR